MVERAGKAHASGNAFPAGETYKVVLVGSVAYQQQSRFGYSRQRADDDCLALARDQRADRRQQRRAGWQVEAEVRGDVAAALDAVEWMEQVAVEAGVMDRDPVARKAQRDHVIGQCFRYREKGRGLACRFAHGPQGIAALTPIGDVRAARLDGERQA